MILKVGDHVQIIEGHRTGEIWAIHKIRPLKIRNRIGVRVARHNKTFSILWYNEKELRHIDTPVQKPSISSVDNVQ